MGSQISTTGHLQRCSTSSNASRCGRGYHWQQAAVTAAHAAQWMRTAALTYGWMTAAMVLRPVAVSMASVSSEIMLPASDATTVAPRMESVPALHRILTKPA